MKKTLSIATLILLASTPAFAHLKSQPTRIDIAELSYSMVPMSNIVRDCNNGRYSQIAANIDEITRIEMTAVRAKKSIGTSVAQAIIGSESDLRKFAELVCKENFGSQSQIVGLEWASMRGWSARTLTSHIESGLATRIKKVDNIISTTEAVYDETEYAMGSFSCSATKKSLKTPTPTAILRNLNGQICR